METKKWIVGVFVLAGCVNVVGIPIFSKLFTNDLLMQVDPRTFSIIGLVGIMLWGLAYIALSGHYNKAPFVAAVFAVEKFFYTAVWLNWLSGHAGDLPSIYEQDVLTGFFYTIYGANDLLFGAFFLYVFVHVLKNRT